MVENYDLENIPGLGEKKAEQLHQELGITTIDELEQALEAGWVDELDGFGPKTIENLKKAVRELMEAEDDSFEEEDIEIIVEEPIVEEPSFSEPQEYTNSFKVTNRVVDRLFTDVSTRVRNKYDYIIVTADKHYVREQRINFLFALVINMAKQGATIKFPEEFFNDMPEAYVEDGYWIIEKGE